MKFLKFISIIAATIIIISSHACSKKSDFIKFKITSHKTGEIVSRPLPLTIRGKILNYNKKESLYIYIAEQSTREKIWHIEPRARVNSKGRWRALTWLGNRKQGKRNLFRVCVFALDSPLELNNGDHPVKEKPDSIGELCIKLKRSR